MLQHKAAGASEQRAMPDPCRCSQRGKTSEAHLCLQWRENCRVPRCTNTNGGESLTDLYIATELQAPDCSCRWIRGQ